MVLMTETGAVQYLGGEKPLSIKTMQRWRLDGKGPIFIKIGRLVRYDKDSLDAYITGRIRQSTSDEAGK